LIKGACVPVNNDTYQNAVLPELKNGGNILIRFAADLYRMKNQIAITIGGSIILSIIVSFTLMIDAAFINKVCFYMIGALGFIG
jgi:hypothetical protein